MNITALSAVRQDALRHQLLFTVDVLRRRRASLIAEADITDYVALHWLEWHGGNLRTTTTGENLCKQLRAALGKPTLPADV